jgi:hypothetical protein
MFDHRCGAYILVCLAVMCSILLIIHGCATAPVEPPINPDIARADLKTVEDIISILPKDDTIPVVDIEQKLLGECLSNDISGDMKGSKSLNCYKYKSCYFSKELDQDFGVERINILVGLKCISIDLNILTLNGKVGSYEVNVHNPQNVHKWEQLKNDISAIFIAYDLPELVGYKYETAGFRRFGSVFDSFQRAVEDKLGALQDVYVPIELRQAYLFLTSPCDNSVVGDHCGYAGTWANLHIYKLVHAKRMDLLANVLRGYNPGGRVQTAIALLRMQRQGFQLPAEVVDTIARVAALDTDIHVCHQPVARITAKGKDVITAFVGGNAALESFLRTHSNYPVAQDE